MKFYGPAIIEAVQDGPTWSVWNVIDSGAPEQPAIIRSFRVREHGLYAKGTAQFVCDLLNDLEIDYFGEWIPIRKNITEPVNWICTKCGTLGVADSRESAQKGHDSFGDCGYTVEMIP